MNKKGIQQIKCLTTIFVAFVLCMLHTPASAQTSPVTLQMENAKLEEVIKAIEDQTRYLFLYKRGVDLNQRVSVQVATRPLKEALDQLVSKTDLQYTVQDLQIILSVRPKSTASQTSVQGTVTDGASPIIGATVVIAGTTRGTSTDALGHYLLSDVAVGNRLTVSCIGYEPLDVVYNGQTTLNVVLKDAVTELESVVVTALGIKREQKALSYNVQQVNQSDYTLVKDANLINSLAGKVAGATINSSSSGVGGAAKVVLRGVKSIEQSNNALYVIDGIPMHNFGGGGAKEQGSKGATEGIADINPDDIESISVLTGAAAAALYGSNAANGAIVITTKRGEAGKLRVNVSSHTEFMNPLVLPRFQNRYGTGSRGKAAGSTTYSWGAKLTPAGEMGYSPEEFFDTGVVCTNSVNLSGGTEKNQTFFSAAALNSDGIIPNNTYNRYNFNIRNTTSFLKDKLTLDVSATYIIQNDRNMTNQGVYSNPLVPAYLFPRGDDFSLARSFERWDPARQIMTMYWPQGEGDLRMQNPYWIAHRNLRNNDKKRYMLSASLSYDILDWLNVAGRIRIDNTNNLYTQKLYASSAPTLTEGSSQGHYTEARNNDSQVYGDALVNINKRLGDFSFVANIGASIVSTKADESVYQGPIAEDGIPNVFTVYAVDRTKSRARRDRWQEQTQSIFANIEVGWKSMIYLTLTGRNDWASQLANSPQSSFFYPSVGLSLIVSQMAELPKAIDYLKIRGSYSSVGTPFPRHLTSPTYEYDESSLSWKPKTHYPIGQLYPERTNSWEIGLDMRLFKDFNLSATFYRADTSNQTFDPKISVSSGYSTIYLQTGHVRNTGFEGLVGFGHGWRDFRWESTYTFSWNQNKIIELVKDYRHPETGELISKDRLDIKGLGKAKFILKEGGSIGDLYTNSDFKTDVNGKIEVDPSGNLVTRDNFPDMKLGSVLPKYNMSWGNSFSWRGIQASALITARIGGVVYSATQAAMDQYGVSEVSAAARDAGGVVVNGRSRVDAETWYTAAGSQSGLPQYYTYSATNVRLQEASIGYTIPRKWLGGWLDITVSFVGRNLCMIYNKAPFDPESVATTENHYQGIDYFMIPSTRNLGFNIKLNF